jgi:hypothetical protein
MVLAIFSHAFTISGTHSFLCNWEVVGDTLMVVWRHVGLTSHVLATVDAPKIIQAVQRGCIVGARGILLLRTSMTRISAVWLKRNVLKKNTKTILSQHKLKIYACVRYDMKLHAHKHFSLKDFWDLKQCKHSLGLFFEQMVHITLELSIRSTYQCYEMHYVTGSYNGWDCNKCLHYRSICDLQMYKATTLQNNKYTWQ